MLSIISLSKSYGNQTVFDDVTFTVNPQERVGLIGRNGSGKTTLFRLILGEEQPDSGVLHVPGYYTLGHLSQHIAFGARTVLEEACLGLKKEEDGTDRTYRAKAILAGLGFDQADFSRSPVELSGGFQIRLNLARVLVSEPHLLLLDEPTNYLDILSIRWLTQFLKGWKNELILITHDRAFMDSVTTHTMGIYRSRVRKIQGPTHKLYQQILQEEELHEKTRINEERKRRDVEQFINRFRAQATRARAVQARIRALQKRESLEKLTQSRTLDFQFPPAPFPGKWLMECRDLDFSYDGDSPLFRGLSFAVGKRDRIGVIGKNGKGKSTLLNVLTGDLTPGDGNIGYGEKLRMGYFGQTNIDRLNPDNTVEDEILNSSADLNRGSARNICGAMLFEGDQALKKIAVLSGGEKSRVLLGKLLATPANLLLLDEPTNHLDMESIDSLLEAIDTFQGGIVIATHSEMILDAVATRLIVFDGGNATLFEGSYQDFLERVGWEEERTTTEPGQTAAQERPRGTDRKELRRLKAELVNSRSRVLQPLQKRMDGLERRIVDLEKRVDEENRLLVRASQAGDGKSIAALSMSIHDARKDIEQLFEELDEVTREHLVLAQEFEARTKELEEKGRGSRE
jgi:ATP-binding cassette subfamily F protein 3